jgi:hypothetical protein
MCAETLRVLTKFSRHLLDLALHGLRVVDEGSSRRRQAYAPSPTLKQRGTQALLHSFDPGAGGRQRETGPLRTQRDTAALGNKEKQTEIQEIEAHSPPISLAFV